MPAARAWLALAVGSLVAAGGLAVALVLGRAPGFDRLPLDPAFFRRCLVVHVDLSLVAWQLAFLGALWSCLPASRRAGQQARRGALVAATGIGLLLLSTLVPGAEPVLSNYVPAVDHALFAIGLAVFGGGLAIALLDGRLTTTPPAPSAFHAPESAGIFLRAAGLAALIALMTFLVAAATLPSGLIPLARWERWAWGGGHVLQFAGVAAMLCCWQVLIDRAGATALSARAARVLAMVLVAPVLLAPALAGRMDGGRRAFTLLMEIGIAPVTLVALVAGARALLRARREGRLDASRIPFAVAFAASAALTLFGFGLGFSITGSTTVIPAHYHAAIGGVTVAFMAVAPLMLPALGFGALGATARRLARWQPPAFAAGQGVFAAGFAIAGLHGMARKVYGAEQARSLGETVGLAIMSLGGLVAVAAGLAFLVIVGASIARGLRRSMRAPRRTPWKNEEVSALASRS